LKTVCPFSTLLAAAGVFLRPRPTLFYWLRLHEAIHPRIYALKRRVSCGSNLRARYTRARAGYASFIIYRTLEYGESTTVSTRFCAPRRQSAGTSIVVHCINSIILICFAFIMLYTYLACCERNFYQNHYYDLAMTFLSIFLLFSKCKAHQCCLFIRDSYFHCYFTAIFIF